MSNDERNFRSAYYEKVGFKSVEEKRSLEMLLKEGVLDPNKLKQFCLRFSVPHVYRSFVWKILLDVIPKQVHCQDFIMKQRKQEYDDLHQTLVITDVIDEKTPQDEILLYMWLIKSDNFTFDSNIKDTTESCCFTAIVDFLLHCFDDEVDVYWIASRFYDNISVIRQDMTKLIECTHSLLERDDYDLYRHLAQINVLDNLPLQIWFNRCFAGVINEDCLAKIWDKICGGCYKILAFLVFALFTTLRHHILRVNNINSIFSLITNVPKDTADIIVNNCIDKWQNSGSPLTVHDKPKTTT
ncbi:hypothetical protein GWI33_007563 [Rhynchophorus ferrugineus]|uniref:TBC1 domain family member 7 n=1 Tax=Rhynchophorus ferrugineus TaxID=354439 RepID=A0A834MES2_RHYFE|nr:hypothetical protein GWI33_007563 [Rhynchophorus ferrugineus]